MFGKTLNRASPEIMVMSVHNSDTATMTVGAAAIWSYRTDTAGANDGYSVRLGWQTGLPNAGLVAGAVVGRDIASDDWGMVQTYGQIDYLLLTGYTTAPFSTGLATALDEAALALGIFTPVAIQLTTGGGAGVGYWGYAKMATGATAIDCRISMAGFAVPVAPLPATVATNATGLSGKAFLRCMK